MRGEGVETPKNTAGKLTEQIMLALFGLIQPGILEKPETSIYNKCYSAVYGVLHAELRELGRVMVPGEPITISKPWSVEGLVIRGLMRRLGIATLFIESGGIGPTEGIIISGSGDDFRVSYSEDTDCD